MSDVGAARTLQRQTLEPIEIERSMAPGSWGRRSWSYTGNGATGKKQKPNDVNQEVADAAADKVVSRVLQQMQADNDRREAKMMEQMQNQSGGSCW